MSLYNALHGCDPNAEAILQALGLDLSQVQRFRDASFGKDDDQYVLHVLCRTGGGNREGFPNRALTTHVLYLRDHDDAFDATYAHYYFKIPESVLAELSALGLSLDDVTDTTTLQEKTEAAIKAIEAFKSVPTLASSRKVDS